jgi:hypothetical protein
VTDTVLHFYDAVVTSAIPVPFWYVLGGQA